MYDITFIIPTFNNKKLLLRCLNSIEEQLEENDAVIIIDDGSNDNTFQTLSERYKLNPNIQIFKQINSGSGAARNKGIELNKNKYIWFVDSDDYIISGAIHEVKKLIKKDQIDILFFDYYANTQSEANHVKLNLDPKDKTSLLLSLQVPWNKIIRASLFDGVTFPIGKIRYQDHGTIPIVISRGIKFKYLEEPLYVYDFSHPNNIGKRNDKNNDIYKAFENIFYFYKKGLIKEDELEVLLINTFVFSQIYNPTNNSFDSIYKNTKTVKKYLNEVFPYWSKSHCLSKHFNNKYSNVVDNLQLKIFMGRILKFSSFVPSFFIFLFKKIKEN